MKVNWLATHSLHRKQQWWSDDGSEESAKRWWRSWDGGGQLLLCRNVRYGEWGASGEQAPGVFVRWTNRRGGFLLAQRSAHCNEWATVSIRMKAITLHIVLNTKARMILGKEKKNEEKKAKERKQASLDGPTRWSQSSSLCLWKFWSSWWTSRFKTREAIEHKHQSGWKFLTFRKHNKVFLVIHWQWCDQIS